MPIQQKGSAPIFLLLAALGLLIFLFITNTFSFKDRLFDTLFPKPPSKAEEGQSVPDEILVKFKPEVDKLNRDTLLRQHGIEVKDTIPQIDVILGKVSDQAKDQVIKALKKNPNIVYAEPNYILQELFTPNDPKYVISQWGPQKIQAPEAWDINKGSSSVVVAVSDSGVKADHEDLVGKILPGYSYITGSTDTSDVTGHGTIVSGIIGALTNNSIGIASLGWETPIMPVNSIKSDGTGTYSDGAKSVIYAADHGAKIVNMSWGGSSFSQTLQDAISYAWNKGLVLVAAAGNDGPCSSCILYPARGNNVIAAGSTDILDQKANFSSTGPQLDVVAPGVNIYSTTRAGSYGFGSGTSFSSPHVAALAALIFAANSGLTNQQAVDIITSTAKDLGASGFDDQYGWGRIDAQAALQKATNTTPQPTPSDTTPPSVSITDPLNESSVKVNSKVNIQASATDNVGVTKVEFYVNNSLKCLVISSPYTCLWKVPGKRNTSYTIKAQAYDASSNTNTASVVVKTQ